MADTGALILHGFTSTAASMAPLAEAISEAGFEVEVPLLPGHGTTWEELAATRAETILDAVDAAHQHLAQRCRTVIPVGLSMGGALALRSAARHRSPAVVPINPGLRLKPGTGPAARALSLLRPTLASIAGDVAKPGVPEQAYEVTPLRAVAELNRIFRAARASLPTLAEQGTDVLLMRSAVDKVVGSASAALLKDALPNQVQEVILRRSRHVATLDFDADLLQRRTIDFLGRYSRPSDGGTGRVPAH